MSKNWKEDLDKAVKYGLDMANDRARDREQIVKGIKKPVTSKDYS